MTTTATTRSWIGLAVLVLPLLLITIDGTVLILGLPAISADLSPTGVEQLWMIDIYALVLAGLLVAMSTVGDRFGRRRNLLIGAVVFAVASVIGALATTPWMLIGARALLGVGGAIMMPSTLSLVRNMFLDRQQRRYAMAVWAAMAAAGAALGPIAGGWVIETFSWQAAFLMNVPVMALLLVLGPLLLPESRNPDLHRVDLRSVALSFVGMIGVAYAIKTLTGGTDIAYGLAALAAGLAAIALFVRRQLTLPTPLLDVRLFKVRYFRGAVIGDLLSIFAIVGALVALVQHLQLVLGLSPLQAAVWLLPQAVLAATAAFLVNRFLPAHVITVGLLIAAVGFGLTGFLSPTSSPALVATSLALVSLGAGIGLALSNDIIMSSVRPERAGQAAATSESAYEIGTTLGTAVLGGVLVASYTRAVTAGTDALGLPASAAERASSTMAEAVLVAAEVGGGTGAALLETAGAAFTDAIVVTGVAGAGVMILAAIWASVTLRGADANADLAAELGHRVDTIAAGPVIEVERLNVTYGDFHAVEDLSFHVERGELYALLGTNGAGKTSALEVIEGHREAASGAVRVFGKRPTDRRAVRSRTGIMLQESGFAPDLTVAETVRLIGALSGRTDTVARVLGLVGLTRKAATRVSQLSGGEKRRLDFATAVFGGPELIFLDEPTTGLDIQARDALWDVVERLRDDGATIVLTTHYLEEAQERADRIGLMHHGRIRHEGTVSELTRTLPATIRFSLAPGAPEPPLRPARVSEQSYLIETFAMQSDLKHLLDWADVRAVELIGLRASPTSLDDVFRAVDAEPVPA